MKYFKKIKPLIILVSVFVVCYSVVFYVSAVWTDAPGVPTYCPAGSPGCDAPINVGSNYQTKIGILQIKNPDVTYTDNADGNWFTNATYDRTFVEAKAYCAANSARLAYYSEIVDAFKNGASVCAWGWVQEGFVVYPMQNGAGGGCGGAVGGVRVWYADPSTRLGAYCARDSLVVNGSVANGGNLRAKGIYLNGGQSGGEMYLGLLTAGYNADTLGICMGGVCKTDWSQITGTSYWTVSGTNIYNNNTGNVGIGTAAPGAKLHISNGDNSVAYFGPNSSWGAYLYVGSGTNKAAAGTAQVISTNGNLHLDSGSGNDMYLNYYSSGRPIHAYGPVDITSNLTVAGTSYLANTNVYGTLTVTNPNNLCLGGVCKNAWPSSYWQDGGAGKIYYNAGNVGIGTTVPGYKLDVNGSIKSNANIQVLLDGSDTFGAGGLFYLGNTTNSRNWALQLSASNNLDYWYYNGSAWARKVTIQNDGNVGIGTTNPTAKLEVVGQVKITGGTPGAGKVLTSDAVGLATWITPAVGSVGAPVGSGYIVSALDAVLTGERVLTQGTGIAITDGGANGNMTVAISPTYTQRRVSAVTCFGANLSIKTINEDGTVTCETDDIGVSGSVTSVFGRTGAVAAVSGDYTTTLVTEGTNLYFTNARALAAVQAQLDLKAPLASPTFTGNVTMPSVGIWNSSGNVGIGTVTPGTNKLEISGGQLKSNGDLTVIGTSYLANVRSYGNLIVDGNVGIGTTNPGTNKLEVVGGPIKATGGLIMETRTSDSVSPVNGQVWACTDAPDYDCTH